MVDIQAGLWLNEVMRIGDIPTPATLEALAAEVELTAGEVLAVTVDTEGTFTGGIEVVDGASTLPAGHRWMIWQAA